MLGEAYEGGQATGKLTVERGTDIQINTETSSDLSVEVWQGGGASRGHWRRGFKDEEQFSNWKKQEAEKNGVPPADTQWPEAVRRLRQRDAGPAGAAGEAEGHDSRERSTLCQGRLCAGPLSLNFSLEE